MDRVQAEENAAVIAYAEITAAMVNALLVALVNSGGMPRNVLLGMIDTIEAGRKTVPDPLGRPYEQRVDPGLFQQFRVMVAIGGGAEPPPEPNRDRPVN